MSRISLGSRPDGNVDPGPIIRSILLEQVQCVLATQNDQRLFQHLMAYGLEESLATIYLVSFRNTRKVSNMLAYPSVSLLWDNRTGNNRDHTEGFALTAQGQARLVLDKDAQSDIRQQLLNRNASLANLLKEQGAVLIAVDIDSYHLALGYTQSFFYQPG